MTEQQPGSSESRDKLFPGSAEMAGRMREVDWSRTAVGPIDGWPHSVRAIIRMMLTTRYAMWMGWGRELTFFYNDAYAHMTLGAKHPWALGRPASEVWAEIWPDIGPRIEHVLATGEATWDEGLLLFLERSGFSGGDVPHVLLQSAPRRRRRRSAACSASSPRKPTRVIGERRLGLLREFGTRLAASQTTHDVWAAVEQSTATDARDLPFTLAYLVGDDETTATLAASSNVPAGDPVAPESLPIDNPMWPIRACSRERPHARSSSIWTRPWRGLAAPGASRPLARSCCRSRSRRRPVRPVSSSPGLNPVSPGRRRI